jgi:hypothetical protein
MEESVDPIFQNGHVRRRAGPINGRKLLWPNSGNSCIVNLINIPMINLLYLASHRYAVYPDHAT